MSHVQRQLKVSGVSQRRVALAMGVDPADFSRWIRGRVRPNLESVVRIDSALNEVLYGRRG